jgi:DNA-binding transcriptional ArsR family regulator
MEMDTMQANAGRASELLSAMSNEKRLMILCQLVERERSVGELATLLRTRQSTISQHLALLKKLGFVESRRDAQSQYYSLAGNEAQAVLKTLYGLYCADK